jgi:hypothetical protein
MMSEIDVHVHCLTVQAAGNKLVDHVIRRHFLHSTGKRVATESALAAEHFLWFNLKTNVEKRVDSNDEQRHEK